VVPVEAAAPAAAPPAAGARPAWTRVSARVTWAGAAAAPPAGAAGALVVPVAAGAAARAPPAWTQRMSARLVSVLAAALFLLGCAEAGLALFAMILPPVRSLLRLSSLLLLHSFASLILLHFV
jgi:hypothetical protein